MCIAICTCPRLGRRSFLPCQVLPRHHRLFITVRFNYLSASILLLIRSESFCRPPGNQRLSMFQPRFHPFRFRLLPCTSIYVSLFPPHPLKIVFPDHYFPLFPVSSLLKIQNLSDNFMSAFAVLLFHIGFPELLT